MKRLAVLVTAGSLSLLPLLAVSSPAQAAVSCSAKYTVASQWPDGFQGTVTVTNTGDAWSSWSLTFSFANGQKVTQGWNGKWSQSGTAVTVANESWNGSVGNGASVAPGFIASWSGTNGAPTSFAVNGVTCGGGGGTTTTTTSTRASTTTTTTSRATTTTTRATTTTTRMTTTTTTGQNTGGAPALHVSGNKLLTSSGASYRLMGVNRASAEFACVQSKGLWDSAQPDQATVDAMKTWNIHAVRIPLNEECWNGTFGTPSGATYQQGVKDYVSLLVANGINPIVEMHWNYGVYTGSGTACSDVQATCQKPMPDAQYAPQFWTSVANAFKGNNAVVFDLFNEPYPDAAANWDAAAGWNCWRDGGTCTGIGYQVAGMQSLVNTVRATGATNVIMLGGLTWANDLTQWLSHKPTDSTGNLMAFAHIYNFNSCANTSCYDSQLAPVAAQVPLTLSEIGENDCGSGFVNTIMNWADAHGVGYLGWTWNNWDCSSGPSLISDYNGTATNFGIGFKNRLATVSN